MLSDHLPVTCNILYPTANLSEPNHDCCMFFAEVMVLRASVCHADSWGAGDSDPYVSVRISINDSDHECDRTTTKSETNNPTWNEMMGFQMDVLTVLFMVFQMVPKMDF